MSDQGHTSDGQRLRNDRPPHPPGLRAGQQLREGSVPGAQERTRRREQREALDRQVIAQSVAARAAEGTEQPEEQDRKAGAPQVEGLLTGERQSRQYLLSRSEYTKQPAENGRPGARNLTSTRPIIQPDNPKYQQTVEERIRYFLTSLSSYSPAFRGRAASQVEFSVIQPVPTMDGLSEIVCHTDGVWMPVKAHRLNGQRTNRSVPSMWGLSLPDILLLTPERRGGPEQEKYFCHISGMRNGDKHPYRGWAPDEWTFSNREGVAARTRWMEDIGYLHKTVQTRWVLQGEDLEAISVTFRQRSSFEAMRRDVKKATPASMPELPTTFELGKTRRHVRVFK
ncbi:hypothetical protein JCM11641_008299 [Rhodosporidiobolus odoratus]